MNAFGPNKMYFWNVSLSFGSLDLSLDVPIQFLLYSKRTIFLLNECCVLYRLIVQSSSMMVYSAM